jgi:glycosyltransferase involved in cell wall biosynthesis
VRVCISVTNDVFTDQRVNRTALSLMRNGYSVTIVGRKKNTNIDLSLFPYRIKLFCLIFNKGPLFYAEYNFRLFFYLLFIRTDIFLACDLDTLLANYLISRIRKKKLIYDSHEYFTEVPELVGRKRTKKIWEWIEKNTMPNIRFAYTVSQSIAMAYYQKYGIKMEVIHNYPLKRKLSENNKVQLRTNNENIIIYQGSVNMGRGLEIAILSMKFLENSRLVIIGDGDIKEDLIKLTLDAGLTDKVTFTGRVSLNDLYKFTAQADLGISLEEDLGLNYRYALPNKLFDYIQAEVPVLVSDLPEMAAIVKKYDIGRTISAKDPRELAACFKSMLGNKDDLDRWKRNLKIAAGELCWENEEHKLLDFFRKALQPINH